MIKQRAGQLSDEQRKLIADIESYRDSGRHLSKGRRTKKQQVLALFVALNDKDKIDVYAAITSILRS